MIKSKRKAKNKTTHTRRAEESEIDELKKRIPVECTNFDKDCFRDLPLCKHTLNGLKKNEFETLTNIQKKFIPSALLGNNIMAEAPTGSGKTLAFVIPVLECLYHERWESNLGLAAIMIAPTRELATQIMNVVRSVGQYHDFSAGCFIGGKRDVEDEKAKIGSINIVVATPGRLLYHLDESHTFETYSLKILILDEADRILDIGFLPTLKLIFSQLPHPKSRQTWLLSATLTSAVRRMCLSRLKDPIQITIRGCIQEKHPSSIFTDSMIDNPKFTVPSRLQQYYFTTSLSEQPNFLFSFLRAHSQEKCIVYVNSCKQARFLYETFYRLKPGPAVFHIHGKQNQLRRLSVFEAVQKKAHAACLICTDVAARGLDFTSIDWVVQLNCPSDVETYIHRAGRTARYTSSGNSLLFLLPSELYFLQHLKNHQIMPSAFELPRRRFLDISGKLASLIATNVDLKYLAHRMLVAYFRSICLSTDKQTFSASACREEIVSSIQNWGLANCPEEIMKTEVDAVQKKKKMTKLERLKMKLKKFKEKASQRPEQGILPQESKTRTWTAGNAQGVIPPCFETTETNMDKTDELLFPISDRNINETVAKTESPINFLSEAERHLFERRVRQQRLKIRADGTAKIKGFSMFTSKDFGFQKHIFFDDVESTTNILEHATAEMTQRTERPEETALPNKYEERLHNLRLNLAKTADADKKINKSRVRNMKRKRKEDTCLDEKNREVHPFSNEFLYGDVESREDTTFQPNSKRLQQMEQHVLHALCS